MSATPALRELTPALPWTTRLAPSPALAHGALTPTQLATAFVGVLRSGDLNGLDRILAPDCVDRNPVPFQGPGRAGVLFKLARWRAATHGARTVVERVERTRRGAEARWVTDPGTGAPPTRWLGRFTVREGRICALEVDCVG